MLALFAAAFSGPLQLIGAARFLRVRRAQILSAAAPRPPTIRVAAPHASEDEGCSLFCEAGAACPRIDAAGGEPDSCVMRNVVLRDSAAALEFSAPLAALPARLATQRGPLPFEGVPISKAAMPAPCIVHGTTVLVTNYQQHIPHFGEGLFFALSGLLAGDGGVLCQAGSACRLLFHQREHWPERVSIAWHEGALAVVAAAAPPHAPTALNTDLFNVAGAARSAELAPGCSAGALEFERLAIVHSRFGRRWFSAPSACAAFRRAALRQHAPSASDDGVLKHGAIALLVRRGSRFIANSGALEAAIRARFGGEDIRLLSFEGLDFAEQVRSLHDVRLLVAPHGAGLTNLVFLPPGAALVEVFPLYWHPDLYFDSLAASCGVWHRAYQNEDSAAAELDASCRETFGDTLPPLANCTSRERCVSCGKQSATRVDIAKIDVLLAEAQVHITTGVV
jgi:hypothetical protein